MVRKSPRLSTAMQKLGLPQDTERIVSPESMVLGVQELPLYVITSPLVITTAAPPFTAATQKLVLGQEREPTP
jgi:hypothetical protein